MQSFMTDEQTNGQTDRQTPSLRCEDAFIKLSLPLISFTWSKLMIFIIFLQSVANGRTNGRTDGPTDRSTYRDARTQLKMIKA